MNYDYEADLNRLKEQQKQSAIAELEKQKNQSLSDLDAEEKTIKPTYYKKKDSANVQSQVGAKNFHEYLVNSGRSNSGIGSQYEMLRQNSLQRNLNEINTAEANAVADVARRRTDVNNAYNSGLASANAQIEADYIQNLLNERQKAWERQMQEKQYQESVRQFNEQMALQKYSSSSGRSYSSGSGSKYATGSIAYGTLANAQGDGNGNMIYTTTDGQTYKMKAGYNPYTGTKNENVQYGTFSNGYQPDNVGKNNKLTSTGKYVNQNGQKQNIWKASKGGYYVWDGTRNTYDKLTKAEMRAYGLS